MANTDFAVLGTRVYGGTVHAVPLPNNVQSAHVNVGHVWALTGRPG
jgi:hypothetical protein